MPSTISFPIKGSATIKAAIVKAVAITATNIKISKSIKILALFQLKLYFKLDLLSSGIILIFPIKGFEVKFDKLLV